jgi:hypothetical protein
MRYIAAPCVAGGGLIWQEMTGMGGHEPTGITITFPIFHRAGLQQAQRELSACLFQNHVEWLRPSSQGLWLFRSDAFKAQFPDCSNEVWLRGDVLIPMDHDVQERHNEDCTYCKFVVTPQMIDEQTPKKVFLSHKGADKPMVRLYKDALESFGIAAWLDEDDMTAGAELERGL